MYWDWCHVHDPNIYQFGRDNRRYSINWDHFPIFESGGSSLLMLSICVGFVLNISADEKRKSLGLY